MSETRPETPREKMKALLPAMQAWSEGKTLQLQVSDGRWLDIGTDNLLRWFWSNYGEHSSRIRVKPEPREVWIRKGGFVAITKDEVVTPADYTLFREVL